MARIVTPKFRVSYPNVFTAKKNELNGKEEYSMVCLFEKGADLSALKNAVKEAMEEKWGSDQKKWPTNIRSPFRDQGEKVKLDPETGNKMLPSGLVEGAIFITVKSKDRPQLVDQNKQEIFEASEFYAGCYARASVNVYAYDAKGNKGVAFGLGNIQKLADGEPLTGRPKAQDEFTPVANEGKPATALFD